MSFAPHDSSRSSISDRIDLICDAFESAWREGRDPLIEEFLQSATDDERSTLLRELIKIELELRRREGEIPECAEYLSRFPADEEAVRDSLAGDAMQAVPIDNGKNHNADTPAPGRVAHFILIEQVGSGGFGTVWRAWDERLERTVAVKLPRAGNSQNLEVPLLLHEARTAAQLRHDHIVSVHEVSRDGEPPYIVSDYVAGPSLQRWLETHHPAPRESARICESVARALQHAHEHQIVHRDLKPANILIDAGGDPHITDFGLAKRETGSAIHRRGDVVGTLAYMSPEQALGDDARVGPRSDIYSLGMMLYELLAGKHPFASGPSALLRHASGAAPPPIKTKTLLPRDIQTICFKAISQDPEQRYATAGEFADDLRRFLNDEPIRARQASRFERTWRWCRRNRLLAASVATALLAIGAFGTTLAIRGDGIDRREVRLVTEPADAQLALVPLNEITGEPMPEKMTRPYRRSPVTVSLIPGDYCVVANIEGYGFHEVIRHVPGRGEKLPGAHPHQLWFERDGVIESPRIVIPPISVAEGMVRVEAMPPMHSFYMEPHEFTVKEYLQARRGYLTPEMKSLKPLPGEPIRNISYDDATSLAEFLGKRLPTDEEFMYADRLPRTQNLAERQAGVKAAIDASLDRTATNPPIVGLRSNVAEWTSTAPEAQAAAGLRIARGGSLQVVSGERVNETAEYAPERHWLIQKLRRPGLGFRCVRSSSARHRPEDW
ncbi:MAG TPA: bifunctional serine/threonine-protein kinase/formylglycine-generating enzyme family protein [Nitrolancea sp.]|nr:bifunctional serine/threonine-protein kinase/formylglycine-generating enzyme family protein [Nitrolancea sp.]